MKLKIQEKLLFESILDSQKSAHLFSLFIVFFNSMSEKLIGHNVGSNGEFQARFS